MKEGLRDIWDSIYKYFFVSGKKAEENQERPVKHYQPVIDPAELSDTATKMFQARPKEDASTEKIEEEKPWWDFAGHADSQAPVFDILQDDRIVEELNRKLDADEFPVIEIPSNVMKAMNILDKRDFEYVEITDLIRRSPAMAGEFIKAFNSALYFRGETITDLKVGLPRLGKENIKAMLYVYSSKMNFSSNVLFNTLAKQIVEHCYTTALIANYIGQDYYANPEEAFIAGLLHDIGKLGILKSLTETYEMPEEIDFEMTEDVFDNIFPSIHERAGEYLAGNWKINDSIKFAIRHHHDFNTMEGADPDMEEYHLSALVNLSDSMARILGYGRRISKTNIFETEAAKTISLEKNNHTIEFIGNIPAMLSTKAK
ncbi:MAG: hypothetical protein A2020_00210 [Lentisphaerae bacterium GWF2_45_14]|nr:MAG: hypothetical protein A2020_00210 [Lentisphaerae bacterium GWF2_45_14]